MDEQPASQSTERIRIVFRVFIAADYGGCLPEGETCFENDENVTELSQFCNGQAANCPSIPLICRVLHIKNLVATSSEIQPDG